MVRIAGFEQWDNPGNEDRRAITLEMLEEVFTDATELKTSEIVRRIKSKNGVGESTAFRAVGEGGYLRAHLVPTVSGHFKLKK